MGAGHDHGHLHGAPATGTAANAHKGRLRIALTITITVMLAQIVGGLMADSLALIADATHMATDALGLGMALLAIHFANRPPTENRTFGYARAEILAALANCLLLLGVGGYVLYEAVQRFVTPAETQGGLALWFGVFGLVANMISLSLLVRGQKESLNVRGAFLEVVADTLGSLTVIVASVLIMLTGWQAADPIASLVIGVMIVPRTVKLLKETLNVLLESAPKGVDMAEVRAHILDLPGVEEVHDLHAWTITSGMPVLSAHVVVSSWALDAIGHEKMLHELQGCLGDHFDVEHCTFQLEPSGHAEHEAKLCH
ncbi:MULTISPECIES: cation diffusion facilitator family transporter [unclassified Streptomyces]|uniref:cation diffusion facilitator family transporter n=1 Tax=unclassified Streptomyces TaxID=2593676 RepID=UPI001368A760|nr:MULTISPECIES: cation diffusion facilitator family transporter [unclassified Streptomyces]NEA02117.1 cation transporter [Streptomyces sp. SID10116]MYY87282.1 cation diffusion facilitator family transporter [Streptomyces sp. SID335]MYZ17423.1 cation diffusion facilitator family transporter [Streptomyces sp. SID337]NDZ90276.1 cation transporter [Streptomyces sp. SID10115]NEB48763.1 cation transporter [Streptomyces sp. SID339]